MRNTRRSVNSRHSRATTMTTTTTTTTIPTTATIIKLTVNFIRSHQKFSTQTRMIYSCINWLIEVSFTIFDNNVPTLNETEAKFCLKYIHIRAYIGWPTHIESLLNFIQKISRIYTLHKYISISISISILYIKYYPALSTP